MQLATTNRSGYRKQVHGVDTAGQVVIRRQLERRYVLMFFQKLSPCLVGIEACASAHHWSRELRRLVTAAIIGALSRPLVSGDELIGDVVEVGADNLGLRTDSQHIVADTFDQCGLPAGRDGAKSVPGVASDQTEL
jgi:hypothetical protein